GSAVAASASAMQTAVITGPALAGFVYAAGPAAVFAASALLWALASLQLARIEPLNRPATSAPPPGLDTLFAGITFIRSRPVVLGAISLDLFAVLLGGATALLPIYARDILLTGPLGLGLLRSAPAIGALAMSLWLSRHPPQRGVGRLMFAAVAVFGVATLVFALSTQFALSLAALVVLGASDMISVVIRASLVQLETPDEMRGRVSAVNSIFIGASNQFGEFESGLTAALFGTVPAAALGGLGTLLVVLVWMRLFPDLRRRERLLETGTG
ncbi:MAG TPA: MFS transporter, partial [Plasticicumulans sp.]|nr:MFS transporter [Plasticicumulans sp.]HNJ09783.1 MFS transporter [Plasticicumulans sp.]